MPYQNETLSETRNGDTGSIGTQLGCVNQLSTGQRVAVVNGSMYPVLDGNTSLSVLDCFFRLLLLRITWAAKSSVVSAADGLGAASRSSLLSQHCMVENLHLLPWVSSSYLQNHSFLYLVGSLSKIKVMFLSRTEDCWRFSHRTGVSPIGLRQYQVTISNQILLILSAVVIVATTDRTRGFAMGLVHLCCRKSAESEGKLKFLHAIHHTCRW